MSSIWEFHEVFRGDMVGRWIDVKMTDGICEAYIAEPAGGKNLPAVLMLMDAIGVRPRMERMADQLASHGYFVMLPNLFYRTGKLPLFDYAKWIKPETMQEFFVTQVRPVASQLQVPMSLKDAVDYVAFVQSQPQTNHGKVGAIGYCMGGGQALRAAGEYPDKFAAIASYHAGGLVTDLETSPHRWFKSIKAEVYVGHADKDASMPPEMQAKTEDELKKAGVKHTTELYPNCLHGWTMADLPAFNEAGEKRHWETALALFDRTMKN